MTFTLRTPPLYSSSSRARKNKHRKWIRKISLSILNSFTTLLASFVHVSLLPLLYVLNIKNYVESSRENPLKILPHINFTASPPPLHVSLYASMRRNSTTMTAAAMKSFKGCKHIRPEEIFLISFRI